MNNLREEIWRKKLKDSREDKAKIFEGRQMIFVDGELTYFMDIVRGSAVVLNRVKGLKREEWIIK